MAINNSCIDENEKRSDQKRFRIWPKLTTVVGSDQAKKRFSVLIQIL